MLIICSGALAPELVEAVQRFRGSIYLADGAIHELLDGRHIELADHCSFHLVLILDGAIRACVRYSQVSKGHVRVGGWAVDPTARYTGAGIRLVLEVVKLAEKLGDSFGTATATTRNQSASILRRLGGRLLKRYYDPAYRCEMELLSFELGDMQRATRRERCERPLAA